MAIIFQNIEVCDNNRDPFPRSPEIPEAYLVNFAPAPLGSTGNIYIKITCALVPQDPIQVYYRLKLNNGDDYIFGLGNGNEIKYYRQASDGISVFLPVEIQNINPLDSALVAVMTLFIKDTTPNSPAPIPVPVIIKGQN
jgi:hypothetical protein